MTLFDIKRKWNVEFDTMAAKRFHCHNCGIRASTIKEILLDLNALTECPECGSADIDTRHMMSSSVGETYFEQCCHCEKQFNHR